VSIRRVFLAAVLAVLPAAWLAAQQYTTVRHLAPEGST
jgi:hypothetical protein